MVVPLLAVVDVTDVVEGVVIPALVVMDAVVTVTFAVIIIMIFFVVIVATTTATTASTATAATTRPTTTTIIKSNSNNSSNSSGRFGLWSIVVLDLFDIAVTVVSGDGIGGVVSGVGVFVVCTCYYTILCILQLLLVNVFLLS